MLNQMLVLECRTARSVRISKLNDRSLPVYRTAYRVLAATSGCNAARPAFRNVSDLIDADSVRFFTLRCQRYLERRSARSAS